MLIFTTTPLELITSALTLIGLGMVLGYVARDMQVQEADGQ